MKKKKKTLIFMNQIVPSMKIAVEVNAVIRFEKSLL